MQQTYVAVRDHLEQAQAVLDVRMNRESAQLHEVLQMVIGLIDDLQTLAAKRRANVVPFPIAERRRSDA